MKSEKEFRDFFSNALVPDLTALEEKRKKIVRKFVLISSVAVFLLTAFVILKWSGWLISIVIIAWLGSYFWITEEYVKEFKNKIIHKMVGFIDESLKYVKDGFVPSSAFVESSIFKRKPDRYYGDDFVGGKVGETQVAFSEIHAEYQSGHGRDRTYNTIFEGLFFVADFNKRFTAKTVVLPDTAEKLFGHVGTLLQSWNAARDQLIKLEDPEFEKLFAVYGTDQIQARYILSTSLMKRIVDFKNKTRKNIFISFVGSKIFVAVSYAKDLFEPRVFKTLLDLSAIQEYFDDLQLAVGIVEDLNLNTRIWSKT